MGFHWDRLYEGHKLGHWVGMGTRATSLGWSRLAGDRCCTIRCPWLYRDMSCAVEVSMVVWGHVPCHQVSMVTWGHVP